MSNPQQFQLPLCRWGWLPQPVRALGQSVAGAGCGKVGHHAMEMVNADSGPILGRSGEGEEEKRAKAGLTHPLRTALGAHDMFGVPRKCFNLNFS